MISLSDRHLEIVTAAASALDREKRPVILNASPRYWCAGIALVTTPLSALWSALSSSPQQ